MNNTTRITVKTSMDKVTLSIGEDVVYTGSVDMYNRCGTDRPINSMTALVAEAIEKHIVIGGSNG